MLSLSRFDESNSVERLKTFGYVIGKLDQLGILYVPLVEASEDDIRQGGSMVPTDRLRPLFRCGGEKGYVDYAAL